MKPPRLLPELDDPVVAGGDEEGLLALGVDQAEVRQTVRVLDVRHHSPPGTGLLRPTSATSPSSAHL